MSIRRAASNVALAAGIAVASLVCPARSASAEDALRAAGVRPDRIRERLDAEAATVILQDYLDARNRGETPQFIALNEGGEVAGRSGDEVEE